MRVTCRHPLTLATHHHPHVPMLTSSQQPPIHTSPASTCHPSANIQAPPRLRLRLQFRSRLRPQLPPGHPRAPCCTAVAPRLAHVYGPVRPCPCVTCPRGPPSSPTPSSFSSNCSPPRCRPWGRPRVRQEGEEEAGGLLRCARRRPSWTP